MRMQPSQHPALALSAGLYRLLLLAYPDPFRSEYGPHMLQVFEDRSRQQMRASGLAGVLGWWLITGIDLFASVIEQHLRKEHYVTRSTLIRISGWAFMLAAVGFIVVSVLLPDENDTGYISFWFLMFTTLLMALGTLGVISHFGSLIGASGRALLFLGIAGSLLIFTSFSDSVWEFASWGWIIPFFGPASLLACLGAFGWMASRQRALPADVAGSLVGGFWFVLLLIAVLIYGLMRRDPSPQVTIAWLTLGCFISAYALARLGWVLQSGGEKQPMPV